MTEKEKAQERFCASSAERKGKSQCAGCKHLTAETCPMDSQEYPKYLGNREKCPKLTPKD